MTQYHREHSGSERHRRKLNKNWRVWVAVLLMLAAILIYVVSLDDTLLSLIAATSVC